MYCSELVASRHLEANPSPQHDEALEAFPFTPIQVIGPSSFKIKWDLMTDKIDRDNYRFIQYI